MNTYEKILEDVLELDKQRQICECNLNELLEVFTDFDKQKLLLPKIVFSLGLLFNKVLVEERVLGRDIQRLINRLYKLENKLKTGKNNIKQESENGKYMFGENNV